ncbi:MAG: HAD-IC family P-type ATPase [Atopobiaceae bacterium]|nr:HAD-IC family P-type ATPase [Atopobiaceae bacterium]
MQGNTTTSTATHEASELVGLTSVEVEQRRQRGQININAGAKTKSVGQIFLGHILTLFNAVNFGLALLVFFTGSYRNLLFLFAVISNIVVSIFQELRAKQLVDKLAIVASSPVRVIRDGHEQQIAPDQLVLDDLIVLSRGAQVPADAVVVSGEAHMNESLLTGESDAVSKSVGSELMSGSFVDVGTMVARLTRVGEDAYAARISNEAKTAKHSNSEILGTLSAIIRYSTMVLVPLGIALFIRSYMDLGDINQAILTTIAAVIGMIPQGLVLLTSAVLAIATIRLARQQVLVQRSYCVETLARVDVLCLDKTGTITTGSMEFVGAYDAAGKTSPQAQEAFEAAVAVVRSNDDTNETAKAILADKRAASISSQGYRRSIAFSSARKYSGCVCGDGTAYVLGAAQFVLGAQSQQFMERFDGLPDQWRKLVVARCDGFDDEGAITGEVHPLGMIAISDKIRESAPETLGFFLEQGVRINVISGDDPKTVSAVAQAAGVPDADHYIDATTLTSNDVLRDAAEKYRVFGRVTPQQKRDLVHILQETGHTVAMTGDGVNDVLALRESDCSVAMASGSEAARNVSDVVLVDSDFAHMPQVVAEGRRSINNLQRSASLFLVKTVYSTLLTLVCIIMPPYPFLPIQMSLISTSVIGIPSFVLALEANHDRVKGVFLINVLRHSLPASFAVAFGVTAILFAQEILGLSFEQTSTLCMLVTAAVGIFLIWHISHPLNTLRGALLAFVIAFITVACLFFGSFFRISTMSMNMWVFLLCDVAVSLILFELIYTQTRKLGTHDTPATKLLREVGNNAIRKGDSSSR